MLAPLLASAALAQALSPGAAQVVAAAQADARQRFGVEAALVAVEAVRWPDGSLGCPREGLAYTQQVLPGWRVLLQAGERRLDYHAAASGPVLFCPPGRATAPLPGDAGT